MAEVSRRMVVVVEEEAEVECMVGLGLGKPSYNDGDKQVVVEGLVGLVPLEVQEDQEDLVNLGRLAFLGVLLVLKALVLQVLQVLPLGLELLEVLELVAVEVVEVAGEGVGVVVVHMVQLVLKEWLLLKRVALGSCRQLLRLLPMRHNHNYMVQEIVCLKRKIKLIIFFRF